MAVRTSTTSSSRRRMVLAASLLLWVTLPGQRWSVFSPEVLEAQSAGPVIPAASARTPSAPEEAPGEAPFPILRRPPLDLRVAPEGALHRVVLTDGRIYYGSLVSGGDPVRIGFPNGGIQEIPGSMVIRVEKVQGILVDGEFWPRDPNASRLVFAPTGRNLPRGTGSANVFYGVMPFLALGLTERLTLAGGVSLLKDVELNFLPSGTPLVPGEDHGVPTGRTIHLAPKLQVIRGRHVEAAVGALIFLPTRKPGTPSWIGYAVGTVGIADRTAVTVGAGLGARHGAWHEEFTWMAGADHRVNRRMKLLIENYRFPGGETLHMGGARLLGEQLSADLGMALRPGASERQALPVLNISFGW